MPAKVKNLQSVLPGCAVSKIAGPGPAPARKHRCSIFFYWHAYCITMALPVMRLAGS
jgi:hypothetical protein